MDVTKNKFVNWHFSRSRDDDKKKRALGSPPADGVRSEAARGATVDRRRPAVPRSRTPSSLKADRVMSVLRYAVVWYGTVWYGIPWQICADRERIRVIGAQTKVDC
ncbi:hypothetical protein EVAR_44718_1 [Eumeta japonica]|uniref:Uncharacterized protein n=1 Tax=Eumeta variegata TaxID=151549 RepID=A0A4C1XI64_EUMVA|nr:hypothetical protein EVAR_44718_1 [Eumeta japonica]